MLDNYDKPLPRTLLTCKRCGYRWFTNRVDTHLPKICPACKSPYWNEEKVLHKTRHAKYRGDISTTEKKPPAIMQVPPPKILSVQPPKNSYEISEEDI